MMRRVRVFVVGSVVVILSAPVLRAETISVTPEDSYELIEAAQAGDEVVIAPGTYGFRVYLEAQGTVSDPIVIRAQDPDDPPVWDLSGTLVEDAPGSYGGGDRGRGCWQFSDASYIELSGIVITGCHNADHNSAGIRYYNGSRGLVVRDVLFHDNDNGLTGGSQDSEITVEYSEFDSNGNLQAGAPSHNIYIYGGTFTLRYSYVHDPVQAQNFHIRAQDSLIEYNWFARARSYQGDLMTDDDYEGGGTFTQTMIFRGNIVVQGDTQANNAQIIALYNDSGVDGLTLNVHASYNTFVGDGGRAGFVHLSNDDSTTMSAVLSNNILFGTERPAYAEEAGSATISGTHNWLMTGAAENGLEASVFGEEPGFTNPDAGDFALAEGSTALGAALPPDSGVPDHEYYKDESITCRQRARSSAYDLGALESTTTGEPEGPGTPSVRPGGTGGGTGGTSPSSGGTSATGGAEDSGGSPQEGGSGTPTTGGAEDSGGSPQEGGSGTATGGATQSGGSSQQGGAGAAETGGAHTETGNSSSQSATGGRAASGGSASRAGAKHADSAGAPDAATGSLDVESSNDPNDDDSGCGCRAASSHRSGLVSFALLALTLLRSRRRLLVCSKHLGRTRHGRRTAND